MSHALLLYFGGSGGPTIAAGAGSVAGVATVIADSIRVVAADPNADVSNTNWIPKTGADLYPMVAETEPDAASSFIFTHEAGATATIALGYTPDPGDLDGYDAQFQFLGDGVSGLQIRLMQGATPIKTWTYDPAPTGWTLYLSSLTEGEAATITDPTNLRYELTEV